MGLQASKLVILCPIMSCINFVVHKQFVIILLSSLPCFELSATGVCTEQNNLTCILVSCLMYISVLSARLYMICVVAKRYSKHSMYSIHLTLLDLIILLILSEDKNYAPRAVFCSVLLFHPS
jgi:hypothetical protein